MVSLALAGAVCIDAAAGRPPLAAEPPSSWTRCFVGGQLGVAASKSDWTYKNLNPYNSLDPTGPLLLAGIDFMEVRGIIGAQAGCDYSISNSWVVGVEAAAFTRPLNRAQHAIIDVDVGFTSTVTTDIKSVTSVTGRLGYVAFMDWLFYLRGGYAFALIETFGGVSPEFTTAHFNWNDTRWHHGWTGGVGIEYRLFGNVTVGIEYNYYRFRGPDFFGEVSGGVITAANQVEHRVVTEMHTAMARVNFAFGGDQASQANASEARSAFAAKAPPRAQVSGTFSAFTNTETRYASWSGTRGSNVFDPARGRGQQVYSPTTVGVDYEEPSNFKVETRVKSGYVYASHRTAGQQATYTGAVDTQVSINTTFLSFDNVRPTFGVTFNLPTGTSYLPGNQRFTRMDPDLVEIGSYGVGFNVNPTAGLTVGLDELTALSVSVGYTWRGVFVKEAISQAAGGGLGAFDLKRWVDPGAIFTANANVTRQIGKLMTLVSFAYMSESKTSNRRIRRHHRNPQWCEVCHQCGGHL